MKRIYLLLPVLLLAFQGTVQAQPSVPEIRKMIQAGGEDNKQKAAQAIRERKGSPSAIVQEFKDKFGVDYTQVGVTPTPPPSTPRPVTASNEYIALQTPPTDKSSAQKWLQDYQNLLNAINTGKYSGNLNGLSSIHTNATKLAQAAPAPAPAPAPTGVNTANENAVKAFFDVLTAAEKIDINKQNALAQSWGFGSLKEMKDHAAKMNPIKDIDNA